MVLVLSSLLAVLAAVAFHLAAHHGLKPRVSWHRVAFGGAFFWLWYLAPGLTNGSALASVLSLLVP